LKKYIGYLVALGALALTWAITALARRYGDLLDAFYPYVTRWLQGVLSAISGIFPFTLWQVIAILLVLLFLATLVLVIRRKKSVIRYIGWVLAIVSLGWCAHTGIYGLNFHASKLSQDIRLESRELTQADLENALIYFRDQANALTHVKTPRYRENAHLWAHYVNDCMDHFGDKPGLFVKSFVGITRDNILLGKKFRQVISIPNKGWKKAVCAAVYPAGWALSLKCRKNKSR
jgi:hypothetical protein